MVEEGDEIGEERMHKRKKDEIGVHGEKEEIKKMGKFFYLVKIINFKNMKYEFCRIFLLIF